MGQASATSPPGRPNPLRMLVKKQKSSVETSVEIKRAFGQLFCYGVSLIVRPSMRSMVAYLKGYLLTFKRNHDEILWNTISSFRNDELCIVAR